MLGVLFTGSAMSADWVVIKTDSDNNTYSVDTSRITKVPTRLSTTGVVISSWIKMDFSKKVNGASYVLAEEYTKCKEYKVATNTLVSYSSDGKVVNSAYNVSGSSVDFARYEPVLPGTVGEDLYRSVCALAPY